MSDATNQDGCQVVVTTHTADATRVLGARLGRLLEGGQIVALHGDLGAGKTTLTQGIAAGLGVAVQVTSPTFTLVRTYDGAVLRLIHMDSYRLGTRPADAEAEAATFGVEELLDDETAVIVIEWAERLGDLLPLETLHVLLHTIAGAPDARTVELRAATAAGCALLDRLAAAAVEHRPVDPQSEHPGNVLERDLIERG